MRDLGKSLGVTLQLLAVLVTLGFPPGTLARDAKSLQGAELVAALRTGGFNIYFRHAHTDWSQYDQVNQIGDLTSCDPARIRQLSAEGRDIARGIGRAMRALKIPIGRVLASPYCRTMQTAELMGLGPVTATEAVMNMRVAEYFGGRAAIVKTARALLATLPGTGSNTLIVAHGNVARESTPVYPGEAEGVVFRPDGAGGFQVVARITPQDWDALAKAHAQR